MAGLQPATADTLKYDGAWFTPYDGSFTINDGNPSVLTLGVAAGGFKMTDLSGPTLPAGSSFLAWCVDIYHHLNTGSSGDSSYMRRSGEQFYGSGSTKIADLERLASYVVDNDGNPATATVQSALVGNVQSAAFQLAVWEIVNEAGPSQNVYSGDFYVTGGDTTAKDLANTWLTYSHMWTRSQTLGVWEGADTTQDLAVFTPVPEPETYAMMLAGLGLMGFFMRRPQRIL